VGSGKRYSPEEHARRFKISNETYERGLVERAEETLRLQTQVNLDEVRLRDDGDDRFLEMLFRSATNGQPYGWRVRVWPAPAPDVDVFRYFDVHLEESFHSTMHGTGVRDYAARIWEDDVD
jgi:hypothetical protein